MSETANDDFKYDVNDKFPTIENYEDVNFPKGLIENLHKNGYISPSELQKSILQCAVNNYGVVGNVPENLDAHVAYISFAISACFKSNEERRYRRDEYKPFALFILKDDQFMKKCYLIAKKLTEYLAVSATMLSLDLYKDVSKCECALQNCDLVFSTSEAFNAYVKDELILFENLKFLVVHGLQWKNNGRRLEKFQDMFKYNDFPKMGERIIIFFDDNAIEAATDTFDEDAKGYIQFGYGNENDYNSISNDTDNAINSIEKNDETLESFEVYVTKHEKDAAMLKIVGEIVKNKHNCCPRIVVHVKNNENGRKCQNLIKRVKMNAQVADGTSQGIEFRNVVDNFIQKKFSILIACKFENMNQNSNFEDVEHIIFYDAPISVQQYTTQGQLDGNKPTQITSVVTAKDYPIYKQLLDENVKLGKSIDALQKVVQTLKNDYEIEPDAGD